MFFGRGDDKTEEVKEEALYSLLNSSLDAKLKNAGSRASRYVKELNDARKAYEKACKNFAAVTADPHVENPYIDFTSTLKDQKNSYTITLIRILGDWNPAIPEGQNIYERYSKVLSGTEYFIEETLKANNKFKYVLYTYGNYFGDFKKSFALIERQRDLLKSELESVQNELSEYNITKGKIDTLKVLGKELNTANEMVNSLNESLKSASSSSKEAEENKLETALSSQDKDMQELNRKISEINVRVSQLILPLERVSKKFDHLSVRKPTLSEFIADPTSRISSESDYQEFTKLLSELKKSIAEGKIEAKNNSRINESISELMDYNLYVEIGTLRDLEGRRAELDRSIRMLRTDLSYIKQSKSSHEKVMSEIHSLETGKKETMQRVKDVKASIEKLFLEYYKKRIRITN
jgi:uncharacterized coiled-coil protein SlyX